MENGCWKKSTQGIGFFLVLSTICNQLRLKVIIARKTFCYTALIKSRSRILSKRGGVVSQHESLGGSEGCATAEKYNSVDCEIRYLDCLSPSHTGGGGPGIIKITVLN